MISEVKVTKLEMGKAIRVAFASQKYNRRSFCTSEIARRELLQDEANHSESQNLVQNMHHSNHQILELFNSKDEWPPWKFASNFWEDEDNQRYYVEWLSDQLRIEHAAEWFGVRLVDIRRLHGEPLLRLYKNSRNMFLSTLYPTYNWQPWISADNCEEFFIHGSNLRHFMDWMADQLYIHNKEDWLDVTEDVVILHGGTQLLSQFGSLYDILCEIYPEYPWQPWQFRNTHNYWNDLDNQRFFLEWLGNSLGIQTPEDWLGIRMDDFRKYGGNELLTIYHYIGAAIQTLYPHYSLKGSVIVASPGYWDKWENQRAYLNWLSPRLGITKMEDWYSVRAYEFYSAWGSGPVLRKYSNSPYLMMSSVYPEYTWHRWLFAAPPQGYMDDITRRTEYLLWFAQQHNIEIPDDWCKITRNHILNTPGGNGIINKERTLPQVLDSTFPEYPWKMWLFPHNGKGFMKERKYQIAYLDWVFHQLHFKSMEDWYTVYAHDLTGLSGIDDFFCYHPSIFDALMSLYDTYPWEPWRFKRLPRGFWDNEGNAGEYQKWLATKLNVDNLAEIYSVTTAEIANLRGRALLLQSGGLYAFLQRCFPQHQLDKDVLYSMGRKKGENTLLRAVKNVLWNVQEHDIIANFRHPKLLYSSTNAMELDIYIPTLNLAFEYQGEIHYSNPRMFVCHTEVRDAEKAKACKAEGITLIPVPYWWDKQLSSLAATILKYRPNVQIAPGITIGSRIPSTPFDSKMLTQAVH